MIAYAEYIRAIRTVNRARKARNYRRIGEFFKRVSQRAEALARAYEDTEHAA